MAVEFPTPYLTDPTGHEHPLRGETTTIGRAVECDIVITSKRVSREHARLMRDRSPGDAGRSSTAPTAPSSTTSASWRRWNCATATSFRWAM